MEVSPKIDKLQRTLNTPEEACKGRGRCRKYLLSMARSAL